MTERKYYYSLDLLKFLLAIVIVFHHFQQVTSTEFSNFNFFFGRIYFGYTVEFFFIISGFVSAAGLKDKLPDFKTYALNKAIRIYPMVWLSVLFNIGISIFYRFILGSFPEYGFLPKGKRGLWHTVNSFLLTYAGGG